MELNGLHRSAGHIVGQKPLGHRNSTNNFYGIGNLDMTRFLLFRGLNAERRPTYDVLDTCSSINARGALGISSREGVQ